MANPSLRDYLDDGFSTKITNLLAPGVALYERTIKPPGLTAGGPIDTTTMYNEVMRTQSPKSLTNLEPVEMKCAYATAAMGTIMATLLRKNTQWTLEYPDGATLVFWGWLEEFMPPDHEEGVMPLADVKIQPSNVDNNGAEFVPVYTP